MGNFAPAAIMIASAASSISQGYAASREAKYNAQIYERQAGMIDEQKKIEAGRYDRLKRKVTGQVVARTASSGLQLGGSPLQVMIDNLTQIEMDKMIGQYNLDVKKYGALSQAELYKSKSKTAMASGFSNAFSSALMGGYTYGAMKGFGDPYAGTKFAGMKLG